MRAFRVTVAERLAYWTVVDADYRRVSIADSYLQHLRLGRGLAEGTTKSYAEDLSLFFGWCEGSERDLQRAARDLALFVAVLRTSPVVRRGSGQDGDVPFDIPEFVRTSAHDACEHRYQHFNPPPPASGRGTWTGVDFRG